MIQEVLEAFERCQKRYPTVNVPFEVFRVRIEEILSRDMRLTGDQEKLNAFVRLHHQDLFLALACSRDDRIAWEYFAEEYVPVLRRFASKACRIRGDSEDLAQEITTKMLAEKSRLAGYNGRCSLAGWLRVAVSHAAIDRVRRRRSETSLENVDECQASLAHVNHNRRKEGEDIDSRWGPALSHIMNDTMLRLSARDRLVLNLYYLRGVPLRIIGRQFGIHEATASRWLEGLRKEIRKQVERELKKKHGMRAGEMRSLWKWISLSSVVNPLAGSSLPDNEAKTEDDF